MVVPRTGVGNWHVLRLLLLLQPHRLRLPGSNMLLHLVSWLHVCQFGVLVTKGRGEQKQIRVYHSCMAAFLFFLKYDVLFDACAMFEF
jgi:hypothetical protein